MLNPTHRLVGAIEWDGSWDALARKFCQSPGCEWDYGTELSDYAICEFAIRRDLRQPPFYSAATALTSASVMSADGEEFVAALEWELDEFLCGCR